MAGWFTVIVWQYFRIMHNFFTCIFLAYFKPVLFASCMAIHLLHFLRFTFLDCFFISSFFLRFLNCFAVINPLPANFLNLILCGLSA